MLVAQDTSREPCDDPPGERHCDCVMQPLEAAVKKLLCLISCSFKTFQPLLLSVVGGCLTSMSKVHQLLKSFLRPRLHHSNGFSRFLQAKWEGGYDCFP